MLPPRPPRPIRPRGWPRWRRCDFWAVRLLDHGMAHWLQPGHLRHAAAVADLGTLAYALVRAGRSGDADPVFSAVGGLVTPWPWNYEGDPVEQFAR
ncbi:hypothetical protein RKE30_32365 [Streptomyces sp. Li-HN-5-11]|uniref:hypothetical protein n=1 Tax=Streptomyces sp. Li-HN-5-11 TaxID=3075432 RepID=UPI0028AE880E|nr:hypothetical protein [Streptomyces sp. Li-HN-5-11]WNM34734.1 hypothetical protein RKE30_32365 [Streptomyces sp. Li-HN-5-11]